MSPTLPVRDRVQSSGGPDLWGSRSLGVQSSGGPDLQGPDLRGPDLRGPDLLGVQTSGVQTSGVQLLHLDGENRGDSVCPPLISRVHSELSSSLVTRLASLRRLADAQWSRRAPAWQKSTLLSVRPVGTRADEFTSSSRV
ncbi:Pentapeptide domain containing protein [Scophthalmus maximus]|uniref:Pentapeptide domain containing protein n=1 Tax=Scophthalmus maximus TaxID=52904 RepID=A0A2U9B3P7_SCOMX|nr:Pentapeptide domain containing protein [Scophthalmus maximus]